MRELARGALIAGAFVLGCANTPPPATGSTELAQPKPAAIAEPDPQRPLEETLSVPVVPSPLAPIPNDVPAVVLTEEGVVIDGELVARWSPSAELTDEEYDKVAKALGLRGSGEPKPLPREPRMEEPPCHGKQPELVIYAPSALPRSLVRELLFRDVDLVGGLLPSVDALGFVAEHEGERGVLVACNDTWPDSPPGKGNPWAPALLVRTRGDGYEIGQEGSSTTTEVVEAEELTAHAVAHVERHPLADIAAVSFDASGTWDTYVQALAWLSATFPRIQLLALDDAGFRGDPEGPFRACAHLQRAADGMCVRPMVKARETKIDGPQDHDLVRRIIRAHVVEIRECWREATKGQYDGGGELVLDFAVNGLGGVESATVRGKDVSKEIRSCTQYALRQWKFPKGKRSKVRHTVELVLDG